MEPGNIGAYVDQSRSVLQSTSGLDEQSTRTKLIDPFIRLLNWDLYSSEVELEYRVQMMSTDKRVDYALKRDGEPVVFIEAKGSGSSISQHNVGQLGDYMQKEWVDLGLITNGQQFTALSLQPSDGGPPEIIELGTVGLEALSQNQWIVDLFSQDSITGERSEKIVSNIVQRERAIEHLRSNKEAISEELVEVVTRDLDEAIHEEATGLATDFIQDLIETIDESNPVPIGSFRHRKKKIEENLVRPTGEVDSTIARRNIEGTPADSVVVVPANIERGLDFLFRNQAWGFIRIGQTPEFIAFYITGGEGVSAVWYIARVADVVDIEDADLEDDPSELIDLDDPKERRKKVVELEPGSLHELEDPIPYAKDYPQSLRYTTLEKIRDAETTGDLF
jgi:hypothetical protein